MNVVRSTTSLMLLMFTLEGCVWMTSTSPVADNSLRDMYANMLQREYTGPVSFPNHQVERKAQRSPSLRLRFGRRSDPSLSIFGNRFSKYIEEINKKPIRSPSLRLRYGKRDPPTYNEDYMSNEIDMNNREIRAPAGVLRYGRNDPLMQQQIEQQQSHQDGIDETDDFDVAPEKRRSMRLRFGRSYNPIGVKGSTLNADEPADASTFQLENLSNDGPSSLATAAKPLSVFGI